MPQAADLPDDPQALKQLFIESTAALAQTHAQLQIAEAMVLSQKLELEKLRFQIAYLKRQRYGRSSEQMDRQLVQMQLSIEDLEASLASMPPEVRPAAKEPAEKPVRRALPADLPREEQVLENPCACPDCGGELRALGEDVSEILERVPARYKVIRIVRPKLSCAKCQKIVQPVVLTAAGFRANLAAMCGLWSSECPVGLWGSVVRTADRRPRQDLRDAAAGIA